MNRLRYYIFIFFGVAVFSSVEVAIKFIPNTDPVLILFLRFLPGGLMLVALSPRKFALLNRRDFLGMAALGFVGVTITFALFNYGLLYMNASKATVVASMNPLFAAFTAVLFLGEKMTPQKLFALFFGIAGIYVVNFGFNGATLGTALGPSLMLASQVTFGAYIALMKPYVRKYGPLFSNGIVFVVGGILSVPLVRSWHMEMTPSSLTAMAHLTIVVTVLGYVLYFHGLKNVPVIAGSSMFFLKPIIGPTLAVILLGDKLRPSFFAGLVIVFSAVAIMIIGDYIESRNGAANSA